MVTRKPVGGVSIPLEVEWFLASMFGGHSTRGAVGYNKGREWKKWCKRLSAHLRKYVEANLVTNREHRQAIECALEYIEKSVGKPEEEREPRMVSGLTSLVLLLLGNSPQHYQRRRIVSRPSHFKLNRHRSLRYCQSAEQRSLLIYSTLAKRALERNGDQREAQRWERLLMRCCRRNQFLEFVESFRKERRQEYFELFG
jgi:hypothetical protein